MHLSTIGQLAHPAEDGGWRAGRHQDRTVNNGQGLPRREQSDNGGICLYDSGVEIAQISVKAFAVVLR